MKAHLHKVFLLLTAMLATSAMWGQVTLPGTSPYSENFNTLPGTSGTAYPTGWASYNGSAVDNAMVVGNAASASGANYNYGSKVGVLGSGSAFSPGSIVVRIANTTGKTGLKISYDIVKIREQARSNSFDLEISTTSATTGFTPVTGGAYISGTIAEGTVSPYANINLSAIDNISGNVWIRWSYTELSGSGSRDGIALDNVVLSWGGGTPVVTTVAANTITATSATLRGTINANGLTVAASFNWGTTTAYGNNVVATPASVTGTTATNISALVNTLLPNTQYNFRATGTAGSIIVNGANSNFYTLANVPGALTIDSPSINTLNVTITSTSQNGNPAATRYAIREAGGLYVQADGSLGITAVWQTAAQWSTITVVGLEDDTLYTFSAKARNNAVTPIETAFGPTTSESTLLNTFPTLTAGELNNFGSACAGGSSAPQELSLEGINLTPGDLTVGPLEGFTFSDSVAGTYSGTLVLPQTGTVNQVLYVRFDPTGAIAYDGTFTISGGDADDISVNVAGTGINTVATVSTTSATALTASTAELVAEVSAIGCSGVSERGIVYSTVANPEIDGLDVIKIIDGAAGTGPYTTQLTGLTGGTTYYVRAYAVNNGGTSYGSEVNFTTNAVAAPVATAATAITQNSFTANWDASAGAVNYRLDVSESATFGTPSVATDLFFCEYVEGSSTNKYLEIYNGTGAVVNLADYRVRLYSNGSSSATGTSNDVQLSGTVASGSTVVIRNAGATLYAGTAVIVASVNFNGDDAIALYKISSASNVDIFGNIGEDPGNAWTSATNTTVDKTLVRKSSVTGGITTNPATGFPTLESEWDVLPQNDVTDLGTHTFSGLVPSFVPGYANLVVAGLSQEVTGLSPETNYYYRVRAVAGNTSGNSNTIMVTTGLNTEPTLTATELTDFGSLCIDTVGGPDSFTISGSNLTAGDITVGPINGFTFSETEAGTYTDSLIINQAGGTITQEIFVKFEPVEVLPYNGDITITGGGADTFVFASGTGVDTVAGVSTTSADALSALTAEVVAEVSAIGCSAASERGIVYSMVANPETDGVDVTKIIDGATGTGSYTTQLTGLTGGTIYYVRAYAVNNGGTSYGSELTFTTDEVIAPLATAETSVTQDSFTANWDPSEGAVSYRLDVSESATFGTSTLATDLFFSEYVEGSSTNKYLEIYNGTGAAVNLADYRVRLYSNGSSSATGTSADVQLSGSLANGSTVVIRNSGATLYSGAAVIVASVNFNGDDAIALYKISSASNVDIFGNIGEDPGNAWTSASNTTVDKTLVRKSSVTGGVTTDPATGFPTLESEWDVLDQNDVTNLGTHNFSGSAPSFVPGYEDFVVDGLSQEISGLSPETNYYYRVRAVAGNTSGNSNTVMVTTDVANEATAGVQKSNVSGNDVIVYNQNGALNITSSGDAVKSVIVYDVTGKTLFASDKFNEQTVIISNLSASNQVLIVKVGTVTNQIVTKKVVY